MFIYNIDKNDRIQGKPVPHLHIRGKSYRSQGKENITHWPNNNFEVDFKVERKTGKQFIQDFAPGEEFTFFRLAESMLAEHGLA